MVRQIKSKKPSCHSYLINEHTLIDIGTREQFSFLEESLRRVDLRPQDIKNIILTHAHYDHSGAIEFFPEAKVFAHKYTKKALELQDETLIYSLKYGIPAPVYKNITEIDRFFDDWEIIYTPGHSIDSICLYHPKEQILISGDTVYAKGIPTLITNSGSDLILLDSIERLQQLSIRKIYPGHGIIDEQPDLEKTKQNILARIQENRLIKQEDQLCSKY